MFLLKVHTMTEQEVKNAIKDFPLGSKLQLIKKNGGIVTVRLASHEVEGTEKKDYGEIVVPGLPPAMIVSGGSRFGKFRIDADDIVDIARID